jgi:nicotinic acid mononucleotide adenylyltransferase
MDLRFGNWKHIDKKIKKAKLTISKRRSTKEKKAHNHHRFQVKDEKKINTSYSL